MENLLDEATSASKLLKKPPYHCIKYLVFVGNASMIWVSFMWWWKVRMGKLTLWRVRNRAVNL